MLAVAASRAEADALGVEGSAALKNLPVVGHCWRGAFEVLRELPARNGVSRWEARRLDSGELASLTALPRPIDGCRAEAWSRLASIDLEFLQRVREGFEVGEHRVEVGDAVPGEPLRAWRAARKAVAVPVIERFIAQMVEALGVLHANGLVHLDLRPETIFVREDAAGLHFVLAGLSSVTVIEREQLVAARVDPFYAPPEAIALKEHAPGPGLCAWDWWSLGRVAQELFLGRHALVQVLMCDAGNPTPADITGAEEVLKEHAGLKGLRAGAVELMAPLSPRIDLLLRGLLTTTQDARWTGELVDRWLRQLPVKEHYNSPRVDKWFRWRGRPYSVVEAARALRTAENWDAAAAELFEPGKTGTLANFLRKSEAEKEAHERLSEVTSLATGPALRDYPAAVVRDALTAVALFQLSGDNVLIWRGRHLDAAGIEAMVREDRTGDRADFLRVLATRAVTIEIERHDASAGRMLGDLAKNASDAEAFARQHCGIVPEDGDLSGEFFQLAAEPLPNLERSRQELQEGFAGSTNPALEKLVKQSWHDHAQLMVLAWIAREPRRHGFLTLIETAEIYGGTLRARGSTIVSALAWMRLERALAGGPAIFGAMWMVALTWLLAAAGWILLRPTASGVAYAAAVVVAAISIRVVAAVCHAVALRKWVPDAAAWKWTDGVSRCRAELSATGETGSLRELEEALRSVNSELARLTMLTPPPPPIAVPAVFGGTRAVALASWVMVAAVFGGMGWQARNLPAKKGGHVANATGPASEKVTDSRIASSPR